MKIIASRLDPDTALVGDLLLIVTLALIACAVMP